MIEEHRMSRRRVIHGLGTGLATVMAAPVLAAPGASLADAPAPGSIGRPYDQIPATPVQKTATTVAGSCQ